MNSVRRNNGLTRADYVLFTIVAAAYYVLVRQYIPTIDDQYYVFANGDSPANYHMVRTLWDAVMSQCYEYFHTNGRFLIHVCVEYLVSAPWRRELFFALSAAVVFLLQCGMSTLARRRAPGQSCDGWLFLCYGMLLMPNISTICLGRITYIVDYLWVSTVYVWWYVMWLRAPGNEKTSFTEGFLLCLLSAAVGSLHEAFFIPMAGALIVQQIITHEMPHGRKAWLLTGLVIGGVIFTLAPANVMRFLGETAENGASGYSGINALIKKMSDMAHSPLLWQLLLTHVFMLITVGTQSMKRFVRDNTFAYSIIIISFAFALLVAYHNDNQLMLASLCLYLLLATFLLQHFKAAIKTHIRPIAVIVGAIAAGCFCIAYEVRNEACKAWEELVESAKKQPQKYVDGAPIYNVFLYCQDNPALQRWVDIGSAFEHVHSRSHNNITSAYITDGVDPYIISSVLPEEKETIINACRLENKVSKHVYELKSAQTYVVRLPSNANEDNVICKVRHPLGPFARITVELKKAIGYPDKRQEEYLKINDMQRFEADNFAYYILYDKNLESVSVEF